MTSDPLHNMGHDVEIRLIANIDHGGIIQYSMSTAASYRWGGWEGGVGYMCPIAHRRAGR